MVWSRNEDATDALNNGFTSSMSVVKNYVDRGDLDRKLDRIIMREFSQRGRQVLVYGPIGVERTNVVLDYLKMLEKSHGTKSVRVTMSSKTTMESFTTDVVGKLHLSRVQINEDGVEFKEDLCWFSLRSELQSQSINQTITEQYRGVDDFVIIEEVLFRRNIVLIVDDMENLSNDADSLRVRLAEMAKNMSDDAINYENSYAKIVFIGIAKTAKELWNDVQSLRSRLATIAVPHLNRAEGKQIIKTGWGSVNLKVTKQLIGSTLYVSTRKSCRRKNDQSRRRSGMQPAVSRWKP